MSDVHPEENLSNIQSQKMEITNEVVSVSQVMLTIRADSTQKRSIICLIVAFCIMAFAIIPLLFAAPRQFVVKTNQNQLKGSNFQNCTNPSKVDPNGQFICQVYSQNNPTLGMFLFNFQDLNQYFLVYLEVTKIIQWQPFQLKQACIFKQIQVNNVVINRRGDLANNTGMIAGDVVQNMIFNLQMKDSNINDIDVEQLGQDNRQKKFQRKFILYGLDAASHPDNMLVQIGFVSPGTLVNVNYADMQLKAITVNPRYSLFTILLRIIFFIISIITCVVYLLRYKDIPTENRVIEQTLVAVQSVLLIFFNDPLYAATIIRPNGFLTFYSTFVMVNFLIFVLFTWIIFSQRILYENNLRQTQTINWKKIPYIAIVYILAIVTLCLLAFLHITIAPIIPQYQLVQPKYLGLEIATLIVVLLGFLYIIVQLIRSFCEFRQKSWRYRVLLLFMIPFIILGIAMVIADGYYLFSVDRRRLFIIFWATNFYTFFMQYLFSSSSEDIINLKAQNQILNERGLVSVQSNSQFGVIDKASGTNQKIIKKNNEQ